MSWYAVITDATGDLTSTGQVVADPLPTGQVAIPLVDPPGPLDVWNPTTRAFEAAPPKVLIDRWSDLMADPEFASVWNSLSTARKTSIRQALQRFIGSQRWRNNAENWTL